MDQAIATFYKRPYNCRVFNLSLGTDEPALAASGSKQTLWAKCLDELARKYKVVLVLPTGNCPVVTDVPRDAERFLTGYPAYLLTR